MASWAMLGPLLARSLQSLALDVAPLHPSDPRWMNRTRNQSHQGGGQVVDASITESVFGIMEACVTGECDR